MAAADVSKMSDDKLMAAVSASLKAAQTKGMGRVGGKITEKEAADMRSAFEKPEFRDMFRQYLEEISDPKARQVRRKGMYEWCMPLTEESMLQEQEAYLQQLERESSIPDDVKLVKPTVRAFHVRSQNQLPLPAHTVLPGWVLREDSEQEHRQQGVHQCLRC